MSFAIMTDSSANLPENIIDSLDISVLSLSFRVGEKEYKSYEKGKVTDLKQFYDMMRNKENIVTSLAGPDDFEKFFSPVLERGEDVLYLGFSSALSGTYQSSVIAAETLRRQYPQRKIITIDTLGAALGEGLIVYYAANMRKDGKSIEEIEKWVLENRLKVCHWFTVDDLFFLHRGGRVSASSAVLGSILGIKPIMHVDNEGRLILVTKTKGRKASLNAIVDKFFETSTNPEEQKLFIVHGDCIDDANYLAEKIRTKCSVKDIIINYVDPVIGAHSGPGTIALFFIGTER